MPRFGPDMAARLRVAVATCKTAPYSSLAYSLRAIFQAPADAALLRHPAYVPIVDVRGLPRILLLGDSISIGYTLPVRVAMRGVANVHRPATNCTSSRNGVLHIEQWLGTTDWDIVHLNFGLHDCVRDDGKVAVSLEEYHSNLETIFDRTGGTGARIAWASTTPVPGDLLYRDAISGRLLEYRERDVNEYNETALEVANMYGAASDGLGAIVRPRLGELQLPQDIHFTARGYSVLGIQVADSLKTML